ncbi:MAG TPA: hypothetical protein VHR47_08795, partial [Bacillota bacterium]|nr:hypothetical protein [Bacillota bacterium]
DEEGLIPTGGHAPAVAGIVKRHPEPFAPGDAKFQPEIRGLCREIFDGDGTVVNREALVGFRDPFQTGHGEIDVEAGLVGRFALGDG